MRIVVAALVAAILALAAGCTARSAASGAGVPASPSSGCQRATRVEPGEERVTLDDGRWFVRRVPAAAALHHDPLPLVIDLHGFAEGVQRHQPMSALAPFGDEHGFVTITPQGRGPIAHWAAAVGSADVDFIAEVIDDTEQAVCIDRNRVYAAGISMGAFMATVLACDLSERIAAVASVAGGRDVAWCAPSRPVPMIAFHGTADEFVSYEGGLDEAVAKLPAPDGSGRTIGELGLGDRAGFGVSVPDVMAGWAVRAGCGPAATERRVASDVTRVSFDCPPQTGVELYRIEGGGHTWPGSQRSIELGGFLGRTTTAISANQLLWDFFQRHPLRSSQGLQ